MLHALTQTLAHRFFKHARTVTPYDILKSLALVLMIADHIGFYFYPDMPWWRVAGRISVPIWLFLIGYARSREIDPWLIAGGALLVATEYFTSGWPLPVDILWTIILMRLVIDPLMRWIGTSIDRLFFGTLVFAILAQVTNSLWEYGTLAFIFAICGHIARNGFGTHKNLPALYGIATLVIFVVFETIEFHYFGVEHLIVLTLGSAAVMMALYTYLPRPTIGVNIDNPALKTVLMIGGRYTLEIYILHLLAFRIIRHVLCACAEGCCCYPFGLV